MLVKTMCTFLYPLQPLGHFDSSVKAEEDAKANKDPNMTYVNDIDELYDILGDQIKKRKVSLHIHCICKWYTCICEKSCVQRCVSRVVIYIGCACLHSN